MCKQQVVFLCAEVTYAPRKVFVDLLIQETKEQKRHNIKDTGKPHSAHMMNVPRTEDASKVESCRGNIPKADGDPVDDSLHGGVDCSVDHHTEKG